LFSVLHFHRARRRKLTVRLTAAGRHRLAGRKRATLVLRVTLTPSIGDSRTVTRRIRLKR